MSARNTIVLIGDLEKYHDERRASTTGIKPGMLLKITTDDEVAVHGTAGSYAEILVAKEDDFQGRTIDTAYDADAPVFFHRGQKGDLLQMILVAGANANMDSFFTSNGDGKLKVASSTDERLFKSGEVLDLSGGGAVDTFVKAQVV